MPTTPKVQLAKLATVDLIAQYDAAVSSHKGRHTEKAPRQRRINYIVDLLSARADVGDAAALAWFEVTK